MGIQIFGTKKSADTRKAERFFKERGAKYQFIDMNEKCLSRGEFRAVLQAAGGIDAMINPRAKDADLLALLNYLSPEDRIEKAFENQTILLFPIVRSGRLAAVGNAPEKWKEILEKS